MGTTIPARPGRHGAGWRFQIVAGILAAVALCGAARPERPAQARPDYFWDRYLSATRLRKQFPDSARALARQRVGIDPDDFLGQWLLASTLTARPADSTFGESLMRRAAAAPDSAGLQVAAAVWLYRARQAEQGRVAFGHARQAYLRLDRPLDASRALLFDAFINRNVPRTSALESELSEAERIARQAGDPAALADVLVLRSAFEYREDASTALNTRLEALALLQPLPPCHQLMECHHGIGNALKLLGDLAGAERHYQEGLGLARALDYLEGEIRCLGGLADVDKARGDYRQSLARHGEAVSLAERLGDAALLANRRGDRGSLYYQMRHYAEARADLEAAVNFRRAGKQADEELVLGLDQLASLEVDTRGFEAARRLWEEALGLCRRHGFKNRAPFVHAHLAQLHLDLGDIESARMEAEAGLAVAREVGHRRSQPLLLSIRAETMMGQGEFGEALTTAREATRLAREVEPRLEWLTAQDEACALLELGRADDALARLDSTLALSGAAPDSMQLDRVLRLQGGIQLTLGRIPAALDRLRNALAVSRALDNPDSRARTELAAGRAYLANGQPARAAGLLETGLKWFERRRSCLPAREDRIGYFAGWSESYADLALARARLGQFDAAFAALEQTHAREMRELLSGRLAGLAGKAPGELLASIARVEGELAVTQYSLRREYDAQLPGRSNRLPALEQRADSLKTVWNGLNRRLERSATGVARDLGVTPPVTAARVRQALRRGERLLAYLVGADRTLLFDFRRGALEIHEIDVTARELERRVDALNSELRTPTGEGLWRTQSDGLGDLLLSPCRLSESAPGTLYVVPDGPLHHLAFETLGVQAGREGSPGQFLVELSDIVYASSATLLLYPPPRIDPAGARPPTPLVAFGDPATGKSAPPADRRAGLYPAGPLPYARQEVQRLQALVPGSRAFVGAEATEARLYAEAARTRILHVAAHAFVDDRHPLFSAIVLSADAGGAATGPAQDGLVQAFEIMGQNFNLELAVLSACETGRGGLRNGEGLIGLSRAFRLAGARNLIVSLWSVDDAATADFMQALYARLGAGQSAAQALRGAKLAFLRGQEPAVGSTAPVSGESEPRGVGQKPKSIRHSAPTAWAPFVLLGSRD